MKCKSVIIVTAVSFLVFFSYAVSYGQNIFLGDYSPSVSYNSVLQKYLTVYGSYGTPSINTRLVSKAGRPSANEASPLISGDPGGQAKPSIAYDHANNRHLMVWSGGWPLHDLYGLIIGGSGNPYGDSSTFLISGAANAQANASVLYDSENQKFLVIWDDYRSGEEQPDLYGQFVNSNGTLSGTEFLIAENIDSHSIAFDDINHKFLVLWNESWAGVFCRLVEGNSGSMGNKIQVATYELPLASVSASFDNTNQKHLVVWGVSSGAGAILGQLVDTDGVPQGSFVVVSSTGRYVSTAYDDVNKRHLVAWTDGYTYGQFVNTDASLNGSKITVSRGSRLAYEGDTPEITYNPDCGNFLVTSVARNTLNISIALILRSQLNYKIIGGRCQTALR